MVKKFYRTLDGCEFTDESDAAAHEVILRKKRNWEEQLRSYGLDQASASVVLEHSHKIYKMLHDGFKDLYAEDDEDE